MTPHPIPAYDQIWPQSNVVQCNVLGHIPGSPAACCIYIIHFYYALPWVVDDDVFVIVPQLPLSYLMVRLSWPLLLIISPSRLLHNVVTLRSKLTTVCIYLSSHLPIPHCQVNLTNHQQDFSPLSNILTKQSPPKVCIRNRRRQCNAQ